MKPLSEARAVLTDAVAKGEIPCAVAVAGTPNHCEVVAVEGVRRYSNVSGGEAVTLDTRFDLASLTKVVVTLPSILHLVDAKEVRLEHPVSHFFSSAGWAQSPSLGDVTLRQLLTHTSGLPAWTPLFAWVSERRTALANVLQTSLGKPNYAYSDLGFILLGAVVERVSGKRLDEFVTEHVFEPLELPHLSFGPLHTVPVAATEDCGWRGELLEGTVHDENAWVMDGVAGHAGLFGTAEDLACYAQAWLRLDERLGNETLLREAVSAHVEVDGIRRGLGWQLRGEGSSVGSVASSSAYGHTGFTGTSLWVDPAQGWFAVLLTNRVHPHRTRGQNIHALRRAFHEALARKFAAFSGGRGPAKRKP